ncbi:MAG: DNA repair protein RecN [bacterium]|nr:DNA repair protein RecN [bacterium]
MLRELHIRNLAIIDEVTVEFDRGLNVLTGETGAGKSIVVDALGLLGGGRATTDSIRAGAETLTVTGRFQPAGTAWRSALETAGFEVEGNEVVVRREVSRSGRNRVYVDDQPVTLRLLSSLAPFLLRIHTQREELGLVSNELQREWLDRSSGANGERLLGKVARRFAEVEAGIAKWERLTGNEKLRLERIDLLQFQIGEINSARLNEGEEDELRSDRDLLRNAEAIAEALGTSLGLLYDDDDSAADRLGRSERSLAAISAWVSEAEGWNERLAEVRASLEDVIAELRNRFSGAEADPKRLNGIEDRLAILERLFRKYGSTSREVLVHRARIEDELRELTADEADRAELEARVAKSVSAYRESALELSRQRRVWGRDLAKRVHAELKELAMSKAKFSVRLERRNRAGSRVEVEGAGVDYSAQGVDLVVFHLQANPGEAAGAVAKVASGGELARLYLALQLAVEAGGVGCDDSRDAEPALIFDEVDAGIGGAEAAALGRKLQRLSSAGQILAVTHLPQVASFSDEHFRVSKKAGPDRTRISVARLTKGERVEEVARMLAGEEVTELSRSHAEELIAGAR